jgi:hypothetical protein
MMGATAGAPMLGWLCDHAGSRIGLEIGGIVVLTAALLVRQMTKSGPLLVAPATAAMR